MPSRNRSWVHRVLVAAAQGGGEEALLDRGEPEQWDMLPPRAAGHGVAGWVSRSLRDSPSVPGRTRLALSEAEGEAEAGHRRLRERLIEVLGRLRNSGIDAAVLGPVEVVERFYPSPALRAPGPLDVWVGPARFADALTALGELGYGPAGVDWRRASRCEAGDLELTRCDGRSLWLRWHLAGSRRERSRLRMDPGELSSRLVEGAVGDARCLWLEPSGRVATLCLAAARTGCATLVSALDIARVAAAPGVDWDEVAGLLSRWRMRTGGYLSLQAARLWAGAAVPGEILDALRPERPARGAIDALLGSLDLGRERPAALRTLVAVADGGARGLVRRVERGGIGRMPDVRSSGDGPAPPDPASAYLEAVARATREDVVPRRIALFSPSRSPGMSHYVEAIAQAMAPSADVVVLDRARNPNLRALWLELRREVRRGARVLVTSPHPTIPLGLFGMQARGGFVFHDPILDAAGRITRPAHAVYYRLLARRLGVVVLHGSLFRRHVLALRLLTSDVVVVPHGLAPAAMQVGAGYDPEGPLVFLGRLHPYKGLDVLLEALWMLHAQGTAVPVVIGGAGVTTQAVPGGLARVEVRPGDLSDDEFRDLIEACSAVLLPYERANQSGVLATAFRAGRPVIASSVGAFPEYVEDGVNGLLAPPGDARALAAAIHRLHRDPAFARGLAEGARRAWDEVLSPERACADIVGALSRA